MFEDFLYPGVYFSPMGREVVKDAVLKVDPNLQSSVPEPVRQFTPLQIATNMRYGVYSGMQQMFAMCKSKLRGR